MGGDKLEGVAFLAYNPLYVCPVLTPSLHLLFLIPRCELHRIQVNMSASDLQKSMASMIAVFYKYSGKEGDKKTLSKGELKDLLTNEMGDVIGKSTDQAALDKIFKDLDANRDGTVDFQEYVTLVACITMMCNEFFQK
ncbi:ictacalcin-like [Misgurnus anguillicaudatus]|uniref:ictacalcin-like n=1 Tax=Misgurnus anguillicaudatus TaxID=75329 RepID=UPI003CCFC001